MGDGLVDGQRTPVQATLRLVEAVLEDGMRNFLRLARVPHTRASRQWREELHWLTSRDRSEPRKIEPNEANVLGIDTCAQVIFHDLIERGGFPTWRSPRRTWIRGRGPVRHAAPQRHGAAGREAETIGRLEARPARS